MSWSQCDLITHCHIHLVWDSGSYIFNPYPANVEIMVSSV